MYKKNKDKIIMSLNTAGFTIVEALIAIGILSLSVVATFTAVQNGIFTSSTVKESVQSFYLAQEAMEYLKNIRDENALRFLDGSPTNWLEGIAENAGDPCFFGKVCIIDTPANVVTACSGNETTCPPLKQDANTRLFGYQSGATWTNTIFTRSVAFSEPIGYTNPDEVMITVQVNWVSHGVPKTFMVNDILFKH